jgi:hypothetical protein
MNQKSGAAQVVCCPRGHHFSVVFDDATGAVQQEFLCPCCQDRSQINLPHRVTKFEPLRHTGSGGR